MQEDGRRSFTRIANALGVSVGTIRNRYSRLLADGTLHVIGRADPHGVGFRAPANIHVAVRPANRIEAVAEEVASYPEVSYVAMISGEFDLEVDLMCRDMEHFTEIVTRRLPAIEGVIDTRTSMILRVIKYGQPDLRIVRENQEKPDDDRAYSDVPQHR